MAVSHTRRICNSCHEGGHFAAVCRVTVDGPLAARAVVANECMTWVVLRMPAASALAAIFDLEQLTLTAPPTLPDFGEPAPPIFATYATYLYLVYRKSTDRHAAGKRDIPTLHP